MYSGYLEIPNKQRKLHYVFAESQNDPATDPLVIWFNGGPGCSSMLGFIQEHGPYSMPDGDPNFYENPNSWNKEANMLYIESPAGVGYSYFWDRETDSFDDLTSSEDNYAALEAFYEKFPEYLDHDLFISGESYAGIYVPYLAWQVIQNGLKYNLKGIIVGNGVTNYTYDTGKAYGGTAFWHNLYSLEMLDEIKENHCTWLNIDGVKPGKENEEACTNLYYKFRSLVSEINIYDVYRKCYTDEDIDRLGTTMINGELKTYKRGMTAREYTPFAFDDDHIDESLRLNPPCVYGSGPTDYLNRQDVRDALNVETDQPWELCVGAERINYSRGEKASYWIYPTLFENNIRVLHFSGNADGSVPTQGTRDWIHSLNLPKARDFGPFYIEDKQVGGFVEYFEGITFAAITGIGHMAAQWSPVATKHVVYQFIKDLPIDGNDNYASVTA
uniref:Carboxypeptidase n=1 Tax=Euplotes crassus TaxID=5936 RepID=A0A7S3KQX2_EUPCR